MFAEESRGLCLAVKEKFDVCFLADLLIENIAVVLHYGDASEASISGRAAYAIFA